jgi:hypothetical protein
MKNPRTSEEMLAIANKYALVEEATLKTRESKKDKKSSHSDRPGTSKSNNRKRKPYHCVANVEKPCRNRTEYWPRSGEYEGFMYAIFIFHPKENIRLGTTTSYKVSPTRSSNRPKRLNKRRRRRTQRTTS